MVSWLRRFYFENDRYRAFLLAGCMIDYKNKLISFALLIFLKTTCLAYDFDARWIELPNSSYNPRDTPAVIYDSSLNRIIMFGGGKWDNIDGGIASFFCTNQILEFKAGSWREINRVGTMIRPRVWPNICFDPSQNRIIMGGGEDVPNSYTDTWALVGDTFTQINNSWPEGSQGRGMFFNSKRNTVSYINALGQIYELNNNQWGSMNIALPDWGTESQELFGFSYSYNHESGKLIVFAGETDFPTHPTKLTSDTYTFNTNTNIWSLIDVPTHPSARYYASMTYHPIRHSHVLVGGNSYGSDAMDDVWEYNDVTISWKQLNIENPIGFRGHRLIYDTNEGKIYCLGGFTTGWIYSNEIYELQFLQKASVNNWKLYTKN